MTETSATIWVETDAACSVTVTAAGHRADAPTFTVHGHHYAVCELTGLPPGSAAPYEVQLDGVPVWPEAGSEYPPSLVRTLDNSAPVRILFGSCHMATDHSPETERTYGTDMLRAQALRLADQRRAQGPGATAGAAEPTYLLLIGDQVYADELQPEMRQYLRESRAAPTATAGANPDRAAAEPPEDEVVFFDEYAELYRQAWTDPDIRWLLSTVPTLMLFDDHDIRDDWNTSGTWRREIAENPWWAPRITSGLGAYWIYQHLGNLSPEQRRADPVFGKVLAEDDAGGVVDAFAWCAHIDPYSYRWSHRHNVGNTRLVLIDTRCGRVVDDDRQRNILDREERVWLDKQFTGDVDHLVIASTLPYLLPASVHHLEAWNEAVCAGSWGSALRGPGEKLRQAVDLEHWAAFQRSFRWVADSITQVAAGQRGAAPASVLFLGGDVHFSYLARARPRGRARRSGVEGVSTGTSGTAIAQLVSSPLRNRMPSLIGKLTRVAASPVAGAAAAVLARLAGVRRPALAWRLDRGPWYGNVLATLSLSGRSAEVAWDQVAPSGASAGADAPDTDARPEVHELARHRIAN
ncbi:hypothetical protein F4561_003099 [Lipingzhangella halophila]|uniref:PhoD-like phosphatase n=1 Tax=Lipingzhangella halophila TaxID=1783352 RepID=A0A7W7W3X8_9ACTN|nr:alkaline phosphatase D family protein [Lipingzhangella halophila]MBB4932279.1 hypothetical protein [Lipingzhangella halophila]